MFRWLRERRQRRQKEADERRAQLRDKARGNSVAGARRQLSYYSEGLAEQRRSEVENMGQSFIMQQLAQELADSRSDDHRQHVKQLHHGSGDNTGGSVSHSHHGHSSHDYSGSHHSSHDSSSYDSGSSSSGSDSSW